MGKPLLCILTGHKGNWSILGKVERESGRQGFREQRKCKRCYQLDQRIRWERNFYG